MSKVEQRQEWMEQLKEYRVAILNATDPGDEALEQNLKGLNFLLWEIEKSSADEIKKVAQKTTEEIGRLGLYDTTRAEVCKWVQTLICELKTQK